MSKREIEALKEEIEALKWERRADKVYIDGLKYIIDKYEKEIKKLEVLNNEKNNN